MSKRAPSPRLPLFSFRLSSATKSRWREAAESDGRTLAGFIKHAVEHFLSTSHGIWQADIRYDQRLIDAREIELAGCSCTGETLFALLSKLPPTSQLTPEQARLGLRRVKGHGPQCPYTLADKLLGKENGAAS